MQRTRDLMTTAAILVLAVTALSACDGTASAGGSDQPITIEAIDGTELSRLQLSESAATRLDIQLAKVEAASDGLVVPSAAVIIDTTGTYWVYVSPEPLVYMRHEIRPVREADQQAFFAEGPDIGTDVVVAGVPELYGAEFGIGK